MPDSAAPQLISGISMQVHCCQRTGDFLRNLSDCASGLSRGRCTGARATDPV